MLEQAINRIVALGQEGYKTTPFHPEPEPSHIYYLAGKDSCERVEAEPEPRDHTVADIPTVCLFAESFAAVGPVSVWYDRQGVVVLLDDKTRRDKVTLELSPSHEMKILSGLTLDKWHQQKDFLRLLRIHLKNVLGNGGDALIHAVRHVQFRQLVEGEGKMNHGESSLGNKIESRLTGAGTIPEDYMGHLKAWDPMHGMLGSSIRLVIEIDPGASQFALLAAPGEIERVWQDGEKQLGQQLRKALDGVAGVAVCFGRP